MQERHYQLIGLIGFIVAGFLFVAAGIKAGDMLTVTGSIVWTISCLIWMIPLIRQGSE